MLARRIPSWNVKRSAQAACRHSPGNICHARVPGLLLLHSLRDKLRWSLRPGRYSQRLPEANRDLTSEKLDKLNLAWGQLCPQRCERLKISSCLGARRHHSQQRQDCPVATENGPDRPRSAVDATCQAQLAWHRKRRRWPEDAERKRDPEQCQACVGARHW